jgi:hypothetical protein
VDGYVAMGSTAGSQVTSAAHHQRQAGSCGGWCLSTPLRGGRRAQLSASNNKSGPHETRMAAGRSEGEEEKCRRSDLALRFGLHSTRATCSGTSLPPVQHREGEGERGGAARAGIVGEACGCLGWE